MILWIGGLAFLIFIVSPLLKTGDPAYSYLKDISDRFRNLISPLLLILVITGGINFGIRRAGQESVPPGYISALGTKVLLVAIIASLHFMGHLAGRMRLSEKPTNPPRFILPKLTLVIGIVIIFLASMLRQWKF